MEIWFPLAILLLSAAPVGAQKTAPAYEVALTKGVHQFNRGDFRDAAESFSRALEKRPGDKGATYYLALSLMQLERYRPAAELFRALGAGEAEFRDARAQLGVCLFGLGKWADALAQLRKSEESHPPRAETKYYMGQCHRMLKNYDAARLNFVNAREIDADYTAISHFYEGVAYLEQGMSAEARNALNYVVTISPPGTELRTAAEKILNRLRNAAQPRRLRFSLSSGYQYDDNVALMPDDTEIVDPSGKGDFRFFVNPRIEVTPILNDRFELSTSYDFYNSVQNHLGDYNLQGHRLLPNLYCKTPYLWPFIRYDYGYYLLDDCHKDFQRSQGISAGALVPEGRRLMSSVWYSYYIDDYFIPEYDQINDRDDHNNSVGIGQYVYLDPGLRRLFKFSLIYDRNSAEGRNFSYNGYRLIAEYQALFQHGIGMNAMAELYLRDFTRNIDGRRDERQGYAVEVYKNITDHMDVTVRYDLLSNNSNVALYQFDRNIYTIALNYRM